MTTFLRIIWVSIYDWRGKEEEDLSLSPPSFGRRDRNRRGGDKEGIYVRKWGSPEKEKGREWRREEKLLVLPVKFVFYDI